MKKVIASFLAWWLCVAAAVVALAWMWAAGTFGGHKRAFQIAVAFDQLGNATAAGDEDETFSARCWRKRLVSPRYARLQRVIDKAFHVLMDEPNHCEAAFESERARRHRPYRVE